MTTTAALRRRYTNDSVPTASPGQLVVLLYNRLVKDLNLALVGLEKRDIEGAHRALRHAQEIVAELSSSLDLEVWPDGDGLLALYDYVQDRLVHANVTKSAALVAEALDLVEPLRDAFTQAAATAEAS